MKYITDTGMRKRNLAFYDLEFTGFELYHEITEIGCVLVSQPDLKVIKKWKIRVKPKHLELASKEALKIFGYSKQKWAKAAPLKKALQEFNKITKDAVLIGFNSSVDYSYLKKAYYDEKIKPAFHWQMLDVLPMAFIALNKEKKIKGFRMAEIVKFLNIKVDKWHDALEDADTTYKMYKKLLEYEKII